MMKRLALPLLALAGSATAYPLTIGMEHDESIVVSAGTNATHVAWRYFNRTR